MLFRVAAPALMCLSLMGCASWPDRAVSPTSADEVFVDTLAQTPWAQTSLVASGAQPWQHLSLPGKRETVFKMVHVEGRVAMEATAQASASMLRKQVRVEPEHQGQLRFSWRVPTLIPAADMAQRDVDDAPVRVVLAFDGDRRKFSAKNAMLSELARALTGEEMPYATLMYVWCNHRPLDSVIHNPRTDRVRKLVVETGSARLGDWLEYTRDIRADYRRAYGEDPGNLIAVGIMTDSDNTRSSTRAWYGPLHMSFAAQAQP